MRSGIVLAAALIAAPLTATSATGAHAQEWCGFAAGPRPMIQCGYSSLEGCENTIGKGATCFVNPSVALDERRGMRAVAAKLSAGQKG
jgi:hypothetical protein